MKNFLCRDGDGIDQWRAIRADDPEDAAEQYANIYMLDIVKDFSEEGDIASVLVKGDGKIWKVHFEIRVVREALPYEISEIEDEN